MAVYKLFPEKDSTIYSEHEIRNTGIDEILELNMTYNSDNPVGESGSLITEVSRFLIKFPEDGINNIINNKVSGDFKAYLKLYLASATQIPVDYTLECFPVSGSWNMGTGRNANSPETTNGVCWEFRSDSGSNAWLTSSFSTYVTASFINNSYEDRFGGGNWYTGSTTLNPVATQSFSYITSKDIELDITNTVLLHYSASNGLGGYPNDGIIIKVSNENEFNSDVQFSLKYFSMDTHTIFPPELEFRWDDSSFDTGSVTYNVINDLNPVVTLGNNKGEFKQNSIQKFRVYARDRFPTRVLEEP